MNEEKKEKLSIILSMACLLIWAISYAFPILNPFQKDTNVQEIDIKGHCVKVVAERGTPMQILGDYGLTNFGHSPKFFQEKNSHIMVANGEKKNVEEYKIFFPEDTALLTTLTGEQVLHIVTNEPWRALNFLQENL